MDLGALAIVDGHAHPLLRDPWTVPVERFLELFSEGRPGTMAAHVSHTAYFARAIDTWAREFGAAATPDAVLARRRALGPAAAGELVRRRGVRAILVDTGYPPDAMSLAEMRGVMPCAIHEVFRVETCAERSLPGARSYAEFADRVREDLRRAASACVALKTIIAYRSGLAVRRWRDAELDAAFARAHASAEPGRPPRLTEKPVLDALFEIALEVCAESGRPLQIHAGFGDPDIDLPTANPVLLRPVLEDRRWRAVSLVILHMAYPYFREAAFMAAVWPQVHVDLSLALPFLGPAATMPLVEMLGLAPATKLLYGSDVGALPELFGFSADWGRACLGTALDWLVEHHAMSEERAHDTARLVLSANARRLYRLDTP